MGTIAITGVTTGVGVATVRRLTADGYRVSTIGRRDADVSGDLGTEDGCRKAVAEVTQLAAGVLDGVVQPADFGGGTRDEIQRRLSQPRK